jgi:hypothetical protein
MKRLKAVRSEILVYIFAAQMASASVVMKQVALPSAEGSVVASAFSPESNRVAVLRKVAVPNAVAPQYAMQIVELASRREVTHAEVLNGERPDLATSAHFVMYSPDGRYLLLATRGSDVLSIFDASTLQPRKRIALHPETDARTPLGQGHRYFSGVVSLAGSSKGDSFGVLTHDELQGNEAFVGSFSSGQITRGWSLGKGRTATQLGQVSIALNDDGSMAAVSVLPDGSSLPKTFNNLRLYHSSNGEMVKSFRTDGLIGQLMLLPGGTVLAARIDTPGLFSKKTCIERWNTGSGAQDGQFCDSERTVTVALAASSVAGWVVGFGSQIRKSIEGQVYSATGRVDVWDMKSGNLIASSAEIPRFVPSIQMSANGEWVMADQMLMQLSTAP